MILSFKEILFGKPTHFQEKIYACIDEKFAETFIPKLHTIREGFRWKADAKIHMAHQVRTPEMYIFNKDRNGIDKCISAQNIFMCFYEGMLEVTVDNHFLDAESIEKLIINDGFTDTIGKEDFIKYLLSDNSGIFHGQIIHWTDLKY
jgi:hypothetical protein